MLYSDWSFYSFEYLIQGNEYVRGSIDVALIVYSIQLMSTLVYACKTNCLPLSDPQN